MTRISIALAIATDGQRNVSAFTGLASTMEIVMLQEARGSVDDLLVEGGRDGYTVSASSGHRLRGGRSFARRLLHMDANWLT